MVTPTCDVAVVGGGLAGWTAAATAALGGASVIVLDPRDDGGRAATDERRGFRLNRGAHAFYTGGPGEAALGRLGIRPLGATPVVRATARRGEDLHILPTGAGSLLRTRLLRTREKTVVAAVMTRAPRWRPAAVAHTTVSEWLAGLATDEDTREVLAALVRLSSYCADHDLVSADVAVTQIQASLRGVRYLHGGWSRLVDELRSTAEARGATCSSRRVTAVHPSGDTVEVATDDGDIAASHVVLATGDSETAGRLLGATPPAWLDLGPPAEAACLDLGFHSEIDMGLCLGIDRPLYANRHTPPADLAPAGGSVVHALRYLRAGEAMTPAASRLEMEVHLRRAGVDPAAAAESRYLHRMTVTAAQPTARNGGMAGRPSVDSTGHDRVLVAGDWVGPAGNLADAAIASGGSAGRRAAEATARRDGALRRFVA